MNASDTSTIKLSLNNFKSHKEKTLEFPRTGFYKLDGISGAGKTNIFKSIVWALWGTGSDVLKRGEKKCQVTIDNLIPEISIVREKPNKLLINGSSDGEMQGKIEELLGMNETEFEISSYLQSEYQNALVYRTPAEQLELFLKLSGSRNIPEMASNKTESLLQDSKKQFSENETKLNSLKILKQAKTEEVENQKNQFQDIGIPPTEPDIDIDTNLLKIKECQEKIASLNKDLQEPVRAYFDRAWLAKETQEKNEERLKKEISAIKEIDETEITKTRSLIDTLKTELDKNLKEIAYYKKLVKQASDRAALDVEITSTKKSFRGHLGDYLSSESQTTLPIISEQSEKLISYYKSLDMVKNLSEQSDIQAKLALLDQECENIRQKIDAHNQSISSLIQIQATKQALEKELDTCLSTLDKAVRIIEANQKLKPKTEIEAELKKYTDQLEFYKDTKQKYDLYLLQKQNFQRIIESNSKLTLNIQNNEQKITNLNKEIKDNEQINVVLTREISDLTKFDTLINKASLDALDQVIQDINDRAAIFIDQFLDGQFSARFVTSKETKSKKKVDKIQLEITENGESIQKLSSCSTGQQTKIALAFALAISSMFQSPILLLDESLRGLDPESMEKCVAAIKEVASERLILVNEHTAFAGFFDGVYSI